MSFFGQGFLQQFTQGLFGTSNLRDYTHASKTFTTNAYELKPRYKFLYHVSFTLNTEIPSLNNLFATRDIYNLSYIVKSVSLPQYSIKNETLNQYNRKRLVQTQINYEPVTITFHDDAGDNSRNLWYNYYSYYYKDPTQPYLNAPATNGSPGDNQVTFKGSGTWPRNLYDHTQRTYDWGFIGEALDDGQLSGGTGKPPFFKDIRIYGLDQHKYASYVLINPIITRFSHDTYNYYEGNGTMQNSMTIAYETVKYYAGGIGGSRPDVNVQGFADPAHYDTELSPLARPGAQRNIFGQGGLLDAGGGILTDLQSGSPLGLVGAALKAGTTYNTFKGADLASIASSESFSLGTQAIAQGSRNNGGRFFPTANNPPTN